MTDVKTGSSPQSSPILKLTQQQLLQQVYYIRCSRSQNYNITWTLALGIIFVSINCKRQMPILLPVLAYS